MNFEPYPLCNCDGEEHDDENPYCLHNEPMNYVIFTRTISEGFSLDGAPRWTDSQIINFLIEDDKCNDMVMWLITHNFDKFCEFTINDILDWEEHVINKGD